ncbi:MAG: flagellar basal body P-ring formation protein FlgA [Gammaproteobacteria bacterium]|nr:flagellar basal body P-ring formation protein FlgA [Gammaproteobacteria bacterium]
MRRHGIVGILTAASLFRPETVDLPSLLRHISRVGVLVALFLTPAHAAPQQWHSTAAISAEAERFLNERVGKRAGQTSVKAGNLDSRHRLPLCSEPIQGFMNRGTEIKPRTIIGVRCSGSKPWKIYVPVDVVVTAHVLVARQSLTKGHILAAADLTTEERDVSRMRTGYLGDLKAVLGQRLKTQLIAGKVLKPSMLEADITIRRGQTVTLTAANSSFNITMSGKALMDGALNQRIRVQNSHSGRIVEGIVRSREHVEVLISSNSSFFHAKPKVSPALADTRSSNNDR